MYFLFKNFKNDYSILIIPGFLIFVVIGILLYSFIAPKEKKSKCESNSKSKSKSKSKSNSKSKSKSNSKSKKSKK